MFVLMFREKAEGERNFNIRGEDGLAASNTPPTGGCRETRACALTITF